MKKNVLLGTAMALIALLMFSCNKNRFDFDELNSVEGSGQWKLPIGSVNTTLGKVMEQFGENALLSYDEQGNLQIGYHFTMDDVIKGSSFLNLGTLNFNAHVTYPNPYPGAYLPEPIDTTLCVRQVLEITADSAGIETATIKSGTMVLTLISNLSDVSEIVISSPDIFMPDGDTLHTTENNVDLAGATFNMRDPLTGETDSTLVMNYTIHYKMDGSDFPEYQVTTIIGLNELKIKEITGYIDHFTYDFEYDTAFILPIGNVEGQLKLVDAQLRINERNTFGNLYASLSIIDAMFYGGGQSPSMIFDEYPFVLDIVPSPTYVNIMPSEMLDIDISTQHDAVRFAGRIDFNPNAMDQLITICDTSALGLSVDALIPMKFNVPGVFYTDTLDLELSEINMPELVKEIVLGIDFNSQLPFNISAQLYPLNTMTGQIEEPLLADEIVVAGSFDGNPVISNTNVSITNESLNRLLNADKIVMKLGVNTDNHDIILNLDNGLGLTLRADVIYGGNIDLHD